MPLIFVAHVRLRPSPVCSSRAVRFVACGRASPPRVDRAPAGPRYTHGLGPWSGGVIPVPIPNTVVKPTSAEDTRDVGPRENRSGPGYNDSDAKACEVFSFPPSSAHVRRGPRSSGTCPGRASSPHRVRISNESYFVTSAAGEQCCAYSREVAPGDPLRARDPAAPHRGRTPFPGPATATNDPRRHGRHGVDSARQCALFRRIPGEPIDDASPRQWRALRRRSRGWISRWRTSNARTSRHQASPATFARFIPPSRTSVNSKSRGPTSPGDGRARRRARGADLRLAADPADHGDFGFGNVLVSARTRSRIVDFEYGGRNVRAMELASGLRARSKGVARGPVASSPEWLPRNAAARPDRACGASRARDPPLGGHRRLVGGPLAGWPSVPRRTRGSGRRALVVDEWMDARGPELVAEALRASQPDDRADRTTAQYRADV